MSYSCSDFTDSILDALGITVPEESADSPSDQADLALTAIAALKVRGNVIAGRHEAQRAMLAALKDMDALAEQMANGHFNRRRDYPRIEAARAVIAMAEAAQIGTVHICTYTNKHGPGTRVFSTAEARDQYSNALARKIWANDTDDEAPEESQEFWTAFYERFPDDDIQEDGPLTIDEGNPVELAHKDAG